MIVHDLHLVRALLGPEKADTILVIDTDTVLTFPVSAEHFEPVPRRDA
jgi:hypothetical protein